MGDYQTEDGSVAQPVVLMCQSSLTDTDYMQLDPLSAALLVIQYEHSELHGGRSFACHYSQEVSDTGFKSIIAFKSGNDTRQHHLVFSASASAPAIGYILEAPTITDNTGDTLSVFNRNRTSANLSDIIDTSQNPDVKGQAMYFTAAAASNVTGGTILDTVPLISGQGPFAVGGTNRGQQEWILAEDTLYAFVIESSDATDNIHRIQVDWYEHAPR